MRCSIDCRSARCIRILGLLFCFVLLLAIPGRSQKRGTARQLKAIMRSYKAVGLSVAVVKNNELVYVKSLGKKNLQTGEKLHPDDIFRIASISKSFSATSIMQLAEAGKLHLDDDMSTLMGFTVRNPKYPDVPITLRMCLSHTSSINDSQGYFTLDAINPAKNAHADSCYNDYAPGKGYRYCNLNYNMIGTIIEKTSGERFDRYVQQHILAPLGLYGGYWVDGLDAHLLTPLYEYDSATGFTLADSAYNPRRAIISNYVMGYSTPVFSPTGGMKISAVDLARYMTMHMNYGESHGIRIISEQSARDMQTPQSAELNYGFALWKTDNYIPGKTLVGHTGSAYGLYSNMFFHPAEKWGLVLITNGCNPVSKGEFVELLQQSANVLYKRLIEK